MRPVPPPNLVERLARLHLATPAQVAAVGARVRRLAGELLEFESVWIDALAQAKVITPWQATELNAGRGERLLCGNYVLADRLNDAGYAECYLARHWETNDPVRLYFCARPQRPPGETVAELKTLVGRAAALDAAPLIFDCGTDGQAVWAVCPAVAGSAASEWLAENGRMPPAAVLQVARAVVERLASLERLGIVHGDLGAAGLFFDRAGEVWLPAPGLRAVVRPQEGVGFAELRPSAYDYLAPERVTGGTPPCVASDLYACGLLWWHLLAGRAPIAGGNARAKLQAAQAGRVLDVRSIAQGVSEILAEVIAECLSAEPAKRPPSFAALAERLGAPSDAGRALLASLLRAPTGTWQNLRPAPPRRGRRSSLRPVALGAACTAVLLVLAGASQLTRTKPVESPLHNESLAEVESVAAPPSPAPTPVPAEEPRRDSAVRTVAATLPIESKAATQRVVEDLVLPTGEVLRLDALELQPTMRVRGRGGRRPTISVPAGGLVVACENVTFEGIDFIWQTPAGSEPLDAPHAIIQLHAQTVSFRGCSFNARASAAPAAVRVGQSRNTLGELGVDISLTDCVFDGMRSVIEHDARDSIAARLENCLGVASGPILKLARTPADASEVQLSLERVTTRGDTAVLRIQNAGGLGKPGPIAIRASGCALAGTSRSGLISLVAASNSEALVGAISWDGQGSVISPRVPLLTAINSAGSVTPLADDQLAVAGVVRGEVEFSGRADGSPSDSRVLRWQAPLRSAEPPGADPAQLHSLRSRRDE